MTGTNNALLKSAWKLRVIKDGEEYRPHVIHETPISKEQAEAEAKARFPSYTVEVIDE